MSNEIPWLQPPPVPVRYDPLTGKPIYGTPEEVKIAEEKRKEARYVPSNANQTTAPPVLDFPWSGPPSPPETLADAASGTRPKPSEPEPTPAAPTSKPEGTPGPPPAPRAPQVVVRKADGSFTLVDPSDPSAESDAQRLASIAKWKQELIAKEGPASSVALRPTDPTRGEFSPKESEVGIGGTSFQHGDFRIRQGQGAFTPSWNLSSAAINEDPSKPQEISYGINISRAVEDANYATKVRQQLSPLQKELFEEEVNKTRADKQAAIQQRLGQIQAQAAEEKFKEQSDPAYAFQKATATYKQFRQQALLAMKDPANPMRRKFEAFIDLKQKELDADKKLTPKQREEALALFAAGLEDQLIQQAMTMQKMTEQTVTPESLQAASVAQARGGMFPGMFGALPTGTETK